MTRKNEFKLWTLEDVKWKNIKDTKTNEETIKELTEIIDHLLVKSKTRINMIKTLGEIAENYKKENTKLKKQIEETKTLDKEEVGKILSNIPCLKMNLNLNLISDFMEFRDLAVDEICKLAIRKIDKEEIK